MPLKPRHLEPGDVIGVCAPASPPRDPATIDECVGAIEKLGFRVRFGKNVRKRRGFLAGSDAERLLDLHELFEADDVDGIFCARGGYGTARLLSRVNYSLIHERPKVFLGYSDITSLHAAILVRAGVVGFHGPTLDATLILAGAESFAARSLLRVAGKAEPAGSILDGLDDRSAVVPITRGRASGPLIGGNLTVFCALLGTRFMPVLEGAILFFEDVNEAPYKIDRSLTHLLNAGVLERVAGVAIGECRKCDAPEPGVKGEFTQSLNGVLQERLGPLKIPVVAGLPFGHIRENATLPVGVMATLDGGAGDLVIEESAVE